MGESSVRIATSPRRGSGRGGCCACGACWSRRGKATLFFLGIGRWCNTTPTACRTFSVPSTPAFEDGRHCLRPYRVDTLHGTGSRRGVARYTSDRSDRLSIASLQSHQETSAPSITYVICKNELPLLSGARKKL